MKRSQTYIFIIYKEMNNVLKQKRDDLYLLDKRITIDTSLEPEFMYAYQFD